MPFLQVTNGNQPGRLIELSGEPVFLGRHPDCQIILSHNAVSRRHAKISSNGKKFFLKDLGSNNGTTVDGNPTQGAVELHDGSEIAICGFRIAFWMKPPRTTETAPDNASGDKSDGSTTDTKTDVRLQSNPFEDSTGVIATLDADSDSSLMRLTRNAKAKLQAVVELTNSIRQLLPLDELLPGILDGVFRIFPNVNSGVIVFTGPDPDELHIQVIKSNSQFPPGATPLSLTVARRAVSQREAILSDNAGEDQRFDASESVSKWGIRSLMCAPLIGRSDVLGAIEITMVDPDHKFSTDDLDVLVSVASQASLAIEYSKLHEETVRLRELETERVDVVRRELAAEHESILNAAEMGLILFDPDMTVRWIGPMSAATLGHQPEDMIGRSWYELLPRMQERRHIYDRVMAGEPLDLEDAEVAFPDGVRRFDLHYRPIWDEDHNVTGMAATFLEITERKRAEQELLALNETLEGKVERRTSELMRSNNELQQFAYITSHDLQEPLRAVTGFLKLLCADLGDALSPKAEEYIEYAVSGANRMELLIRELLEYSRVGTHGKPFELADCRQVVDQAIQNMQVAIDESGAQVIVGELPGLVCDATQLVQLFQNLIANAIRFRRDAPPKIEIEARRSGRVLQFSVRDNGIGIDPQHAERIFQVFQRLHTREEYSGTGMGLAICRRVVDRHSGRIWVESRPNEGSTFHVTIPIRDS